MTPFPRSDYAELDRYDPGRISVDVDLSDNTNLWGPHPRALARIRAAHADDLSRYPELYADKLRNAVADRFGIRPECVTTGAGSDDVLDSAFRASSEQGAVVAYPAPTFSMASELALMNGMQPRPVVWSHALDTPELLLENQPSLVYVCRPNNPTGEAAPVKWIDKLVGLCEDSGTLVLIDEAYADFAGASLISTAVEVPNLLVTRTTSKAYGLAGLRCGYGVARPDVILEVDKSRGPYKVATLAADAAAAAIQDADGWMAGTIDECLNNRHRLHEELQKRELDPLESQANFILFRAPSGSATDDARALRNQGVQLRPFKKIPSLGDGLRVTIGPWPLLARFLYVLDSRLSALNGMDSS